jgi:energy-coupling factor transporter ATP-binding protein EcfA2
VQEVTKLWAGRRFIDGFSYEFDKGECLGVVGPNGAGKSTLLDILAGVTPPDEGLRILGDTSVVGYFAQHPPAVDPKLRIIDYISDIVAKSCAPLLAALFKNLRVCWFLHPPLHYTHCSRASVSAVVCILHCTAKIVARECAPCTCLLQFLFIKFGSSTTSLPSSLSTRAA